MRNPIYKEEKPTIIFIVANSSHVLNFPKDVCFSSEYLDYIVIGLIKTVCRARHNTQVILYSNAKERSSSSSLLIFPM